MIRADKYNEQADKINIKALNSLSDAERERKEQQIKTMKSMEKLANRKKGIISTSINEFIFVYEKIMKINFVESDDIKQLNYANYELELIGDLKSMVVTAGYALDSGQIVSTYLVGAIKGGLIGGVSHIIAKEAELNVVAAKIRKRQTSVSTSQEETIKVALEAIFQRSERIADLLARLNFFFRKSIQTTCTIIDKNGRDRLNYSITEKENIRNCLNFVDAVKKVLDMPLIDEKGKLTIHSIDAIQIGEEFLSKIQNLNNKI